MRNNFDVENDVNNEDSFEDMISEMEKMGFFDHLCGEKADNGFDTDEALSEKKDVNNDKDPGKSTPKLLMISIAAILLILISVVVSSKIKAGQNGVVLNNDVQFVTENGQVRYVAENVTKTDLSGLNITDYSPLSSLKNLESIDLSGSNVKTLVIFDGCENLKKVDLTGSQFSKDECIDFYNKHPDTMLICDVVISEEVYSTTIEELELSETSETVLGEIAVLKHLKTLKLNNTDDISEEAIEDLRQKLPECHIIYNITLLGKNVSTDTELIDLRGTKYSYDEYKAAFDKYLKNFFNLKKVDMCYCKLSDKKMDELNHTYEGIKFVWMVSVANGRWMVRTDAVVFATLNETKDVGKIYGDKEFAALYTYCTDLVALDVGHNFNKDLTLMGNLTKLRAVILTGNRVYDLTPFSALKDLEFIEANSYNQISSVEPLRDLPNLKYINVFISKGVLTDLSPLYDHPSLEICLFPNSVSSAERETFQQSNPNCNATYYADGTTAKGGRTTTNKIWRENKYRVKVKKAFTNWRTVVGFNEETGEYIFDENTNQYKVFK